MNDMNEHENTSGKHGGSDDQKSWFEKPKSINLIIAALVVICIGLVAADLMYHNDHPHFDIEKTFGFQAWFGFAAFVIVVFLGRFLRLFIRREENYYDQ